MIALVPLTTVALVLWFLRALMLFSYFRSALTERKLPSLSTLEVTNLRLSIKSQIFQLTHTIYFRRHKVHLPYAGSRIKRVLHMIPSNQFHRSSHTSFVCSV